LDRAVDMAGSRLEHLYIALQYIVNRYI